MRFCSGRGGEGDFVLFDPLGTQVQLSNTLGVLDRFLLEAVRVQYVKNLTGSNFLGFNLYCPNSLVQSSWKHGLSNYPDPSDVAS